ncbi:UDP-glycosyltransferase 71A16, partial [Cucurbita argyrosperma subsp. argyrosperma]
MKKFEVVFIPGPGMGHLASTVEMAKLLVARDARLSVSVLAIKLPHDAQTAHHIQALSEAFEGKSIRFIVLPELIFPSDGNSSSSSFLVEKLYESYKPHVRQAVTNLIGSINIVGFVIDMFCTTMSDVAKEFGVPCYLFYTSSAGFLAFSFHLQEFYEQNKNIEELLQNPDGELANLPSFINPVPRTAIPGFFFDKDMAVWFHDNTRKFRTEIQGILINTFVEMESHMMKWMSNGSSKIPKLYAIGPILQCNSSVNDGLEALKWLDEQPVDSVVFLCFGSRGSFDKDQVAEIARGLERSGVRFLWALRQPPPEGAMDGPKDYADINEALPEGFLERTRSFGRVIGWAPQAEILAHPATGGFVSHCGWNSTLESLWHGVPMAAWPMYAEQQFNAFEMVAELGLAVAVCLDYRKDLGRERLRVVSCEEIECGIRTLMDEGNEIRKKVKEKSEESRRSMRDGGSSFVSLGRFIDDVLANAPEGNH